MIWFSILNKLKEIKPMPSIIRKFAIKYICCFIIDKTTKKKSIKFKDVKNDSLTSLKVVNFKKLDENDSKSNETSNKKS